jgi:hypothetical protein
VLPRLEALTRVRGTGSFANISSSNLCGGFLHIPGWCSHEWLHISIWPFLAALFAVLESWLGMHNRVSSRGDRWNDDVTQAGLLMLQDFHQVLEEKCTKLCYAGLLNGRHQFLNLCIAHDVRHQRSHHLLQRTSNTEKKLWPRCFNAPATPRRSSGLASSTLTLVWDSSGPPAAASTSKARPPHYWTSNQQKHRRGGKSRIIYVLDFLQSIA